MSDTAVDELVAYRLRKTLNAPAGRKVLAVLLSNRDRALSCTAVAHQAGVTRTIALGRVTAATELGLAVRTVHPGPPPTGMWQLTDAGVAHAERLAGEASDG